MYINKACKNDLLNHSRRLVDINEIMLFTGFSKPFIYQLVMLDLFPNCIWLTPDNLEIAWIRDEVYDWIGKHNTEFKEIFCSHG